MLLQCLARAKQVSVTDLFIFRITIMSYAIVFDVIHHSFCRFLDTLGTLFHFVTHDVKSKLAIIEEYIKTSREHYQSVNSTLKYEVENDLTKTKVS